MRDLVLPLLTEEPKILEDVTSTWKIENWRAFQSKKEHGPIFHAGGFPWCVQYTTPEQTIVAFTDFGFVGESCFSRSETTSTNAPSTSSMALRIQAQSQRTGVVVFISAWSCPTSMTLLNSCTTKHTTVSQRMKAIGASQGLSSSAECSMSTLRVLVTLWQKTTLF